MNKYDNFLGKNLQIFFLTTTFWGSESAKDIMFLFVYSGGGTGVRTDFSEKITELGRSTARRMHEVRGAQRGVRDWLHGKTSGLPTSAILAQPRHKQFGCLTELLLRHLVDTFNSLFIYLFSFS